MALRKPKADEGRSLPSPSAPAEKPQGTSVEECVALGQSLVQSGHLDGERLAATLDRLQRLGHLVEGRGERGQLVITGGHRHPCLVAAGTDAPSRLGQAPDGPSEPLSQQPAGRQRGHGNPAQSSSSG